MYVTYDASKVVFKFDATWFSLKTDPVIQTLAATLIPLASIESKHPRPEDFAGDWKHIQTLDTMKEPIE